MKQIVLKPLSLLQTLTHKINIECADATHKLVSMNMMSTHLIASLLLVAMIPIDKIDALLMCLLGKHAEHVEEQPRTMPDGT